MLTIVRCMILSIVFQASCFSQSTLRSGVDNPLQKEIYIKFQSVDHLIDIHVNDLVKKCIGDTVKNEDKLVINNRNYRIDTLLITLKGCHQSWNFTRYPFPKRLTGTEFKIIQDQFYKQYQQLIKEWKKRGELPKEHISAYLKKVQYDFPDIGVYDMFFELSYDEDGRLDIISNTCSFNSSN